jgi:hypothetical protein
MLTIQNIRDAILDEILKKVPQRCVRAIGTNAIKIFPDYSTMAGHILIITFNGQLITIYNHIRHQHDNIIRLELADPNLVTQFWDVLSRFKIVPAPTCSQ